MPDHDEAAIPCAEPDPADAQDEAFTGFAGEVLTLAKALEAAVAHFRAMMRTMLGRYEALGFDIRAREHQLANLDEQAEALQVAIAQQTAQRQAMEDAYAVKVQELAQAHEAWGQAYEDEQDQLQAWGQQQCDKLDAEVRALTVTKARLEADTKLLQEAFLEAEDAMRAHGGS